MPGLRAAIELLKFELDKKDANPLEPVHISFVAREQKARIENAGPKPHTRFHIELDDADLYSEWHAERDRIIKKCGNKQMALAYMVRAWKEALSDPELDRMMAEEEMGDPTAASLPDAGEWLKRT